MSNQWLRLWHDMPTDPKWRTIAKVSKQPISLVMSIYVMLLCSASQNVTRGHADVTIEDVASQLDVTDEDVQAVFDAMQGRVLQGSELTGWERRQPKREDLGDSERGIMSAAERKRKQRERQKNNDVTRCHADVTENVTRHEMSQNGHEIVTTERDILSQKSTKKSFQDVDFKGMSQMSRNVTTDTDTDTDTDNTTILSRDRVDNFMVDNEQESEDCGIYANMSNAGNIDSTINSDTSAETRSNAMFWVEYFVNQHGFSFAESQTAKTVPMFIDWVKRGVDVDDVEVAIIAATGSLNGRRPSNPTYYRNFVNSVLDQKLNQGGKNGKNNQSGRKLSLCDKAAAIVQRSIEIERLRTEKKIN